MRSRTRVGRDLLTPSAYVCVHEHANGYFSLARQTGASGGPAGLVDRHAAIAEALCRSGGVPGAFAGMRRSRRTLQPILIHEADPRRIRVPRSADPTVSVIIPSYGKVEYTLRCLASIAAHPPTAAIEVIVVDDATPDGSTACLASVPGIRLIVNPSNLGYLRSCNTAARVAKGEFLLLLNNDTQVMPDWLDPLLVPFRSRSDVGAVGSKLLYPDGRLQEAGCIIWDDGSGWNYGRLDSPDRPVYNYLREVDYCSAASLLVPRALFNAMGGFDERYAPAYCEDSDLAFRLRERGLQGAVPATFTGRALSRGSVTAVRSPAA